MRRFIPLSAFLLFAAALPFSGGAAEKEKPDSAGIEFFEKKVRPVLVENCFKCHSTQLKEPKAGLRLDSRSGMLKGGDRGPALVPGQPDQSRLIAAIRYESTELRMPEKGKLPAQAIADLTTWVKMGAPWPEGNTPKTVASKDEFDLQKRKREHWAWQPIRPQTPPEVKSRNWASSPIDQFILAKLEAKGLTPAAPADKRTLIRRVSFDLIGLPPTPEEVEAFVKDDSPDAFEKVVDRLLGSPHFGERWARHWLDLVRYAETRGHEFDYAAPNAYQYRDYVIRAFNADVPYNQFVMEHLAGDLLEKPRLHPAEGFNESILGTGFWFLGEGVHSPVDIRQDESDRFDNQIDVMTKTFLGLTVSCARCHDHKFDAISTKDYYALYGFLQSSSYRLARFDTRDHNRRIAQELGQLREQSRGPIQQAVADSVRPALDRLPDYLMAAREVMLAGPEAKQNEIARMHKADATVLESWVSHLKAAARDANDPFHAWAVVASDPGAKDPKRLAQLLKPVIENLRKREADAAKALEGGEVLLDYANLRPEDWLPDGVGFGPGPVRPGEVRFSNDPAKPIIRVFDYAAAEKDPTWDVLKPAAGAENDPGALAQTVRAGRTLRTPTFALTTGKLFYLVKGNGLAYAAVDSHILINGPLHAQLVKPIKAGDTFQWVDQDLLAYKDHRAHVEFTATDGSDFAVAMVVQADKAPRLVERPNRLLMQTLSGDFDSPESLAAAYQRLLTDVNDKLAADKIVGSTDAADHAALANWLTNQRELLPSQREADKRLAEAAGKFVDADKKLRAQIKAESRLALALLDGSGEDEHVFIRGAHQAPGEQVPRRFLEALAGPDRLAVTQGSGRLELARQMTDPSLNPFIARVIVNRVWHHLFHRGIVASTDNFGVMGELPTHPELLDYLAGRFVKEGWSVKKLVRQLVLSTTYRMSSRSDEQAEKLDPGNLLLHRMRMHRLEGEAIRDAMLAVSGRLDRKMYGPSVPLYLTPFLDGRGRPGSGPLDGDGRRSLYVAVRRNFLSPMMLAFDTPSPFSTVGRRTVSNVPAQALILMNDPFVHQQAEVWAKRVVAQPGSSKERITTMYLSAFARPPTEAELTACLEFMERQTQLHKEKAGGGHEAPESVWADLAHVLLNAKEFIFVN